MDKVFLIRATWDDEAKVWVAMSDDVPGLATEAGTLEALAEKLEWLVPELLEMNGVSDSPEVPVELVTARRIMTHRHAV